MDINDLRSLFTVAVFGTFVGIVWWAYSARQKHTFEEASRLALDEDDTSGADSVRAAGQRDN